MMKMMKFVCVMLVIATAGISQAGVSYVYDDTIELNTNGVTSLATGASMVGMEVAVNGGSAETWADLTGGVFGVGVDGALPNTGWSLTVLGGSNTLSPSFPIRGENHEFEKYFGCF